MHQAGSSVKSIVKEYKKFLLTRGISVERVILYGSFAKGTQREDSDIDLVVVSQDFQRMNLRERLELLGVAAVRIRKPIEANGYTPSEIALAPKISFLNEIITTGVNI